VVTLTDRRQAERRTSERQNPGRRMIDRVRAELGDDYFFTCHATYPGLWQPTECTLVSGHGGAYHVDERRSLRWRQTCP
jgi:hypothetical protein